MTSGTERFQSWPGKVHQPLGLLAWTQAFDVDGGFNYEGVEKADDGFTNVYNPAKRSSFQLAMEVADENTETIPDIELRDVAIAALMTSLTDQAGRNSRYNGPDIQERLRDDYGFEVANTMLFGTANPALLAHTVTEYDDSIVAVELARHTHVGKWKYEHDVNSAVRDSLQDDISLDAQKLHDSSHYKIKGFFDRAVLVERKRHVMSLLGGQAMVVMRLNFLLDKQAGLPDSLKKHIKGEEKRLLDRKLPRYDFHAEDKLLYGELEDKYIRPSKKKRRKTPKFIVPLQTGYYAYSVEAHAREKIIKQKEDERIQAMAPIIKDYWAGDRQ